MDTDTTTDTGPASPRASDIGPDNAGPGSVLRMHRPRDDRMVAGVCSGLARHLDLDPVVIRVLVASSTVIGGLGLIVYALLWLLTPDEGADRAPIGDLDDPRNRNRRTAALAAGGVLATLAVLSIGPGGGWWFPGPLLLLALVAFLLLRGWNRRDRGAPTEMAADAVGSQAPAPPTARSVRRDGGRLSGLCVALLAAAMGVLLLVDRQVTDVDWPVPVSVALAIVAGCMVAGAFVGNARPLLLLALPLTAVTLLSTLLPAATIAGRVATPGTASEVRDDYVLGIGSQEVDLTGVVDLDALDGRTVEVRTGIGETVVLVPDGVDVTVHAEAWAGELRVFGAVVDDGRDPRADVSDPDTAFPDLRLLIDHEIGSVEVVRR